jgi:hypothetical protein
MTIDETLNDFCAFEDEEPRTSPAILPPPHPDVDDIRFAHSKAPGSVIGAVFVWGQGDAYAITSEFGHNSQKSDISTLHPQLRDTVRPGKCA